MMIMIVMIRGKEDIGKITNYQNITRYHLSTPENLLLLMMTMVSS